MSELNNTRPETVRKALLILYITTLGLGLVRSAIEFPRLVEQSSAAGGVGFVIFVQAFVFAFLWLNIFLIGKRKNWARYLFVVLFILGTPFSIMPLVKSLSAEPISGLLGIIQIAAQIFALVLLFKAPSRIWFKKQASS